MNKDNTKVTIVTVTFNAEKYLENTILSVINQTYSNIEYIIIDGKSTDKTVEIIKKYKKHLSYWISESDDGIYDAMNKGISQASGEWINFMNAGDSFVSKNSIELISTIFKNVDMAYGGAQFIDDNSNIIKTTKPFPPSSVWSGTYVLHQSLFLKTYIMKKYMFNTHYKLAAERDLFMRLYLDNVSYKYINDPISIFLMNSNSSSTKFDVLDTIEAMNVIAKYMDDPQRPFKHNSFSKLLILSKKYLDNKLAYKFSIDFNKIYDFSIEVASQYKNILIYGNGKITKSILHIFKNNNISIIDNITYNPYKSYKYDIILITVLGREQEIISNLTQSFDEKKIITFEHIFD